MSFRYAFPEAERVTEDPVDLPDLAGLEAIALPGEVQPIDADRRPDDVAEESPGEDEENEDTDPEHDTLVEGEDGAAALEELAALAVEEEEGPGLELLADFDSLAEAPTGEVRVASFDPADEEGGEEDVADYLLAELQALERSVEGEEARPVAEARPADERAAAPPPPSEALEPEPEPESLSEPLSEPDFSDEIDIPMEIEESSGLLSLAELEDDVPPPLPATPPLPEPETKKPEPPSKPAPSRTRVHDSGGPGAETEVGSSLTTIELPVRLQWSSRSLQGRTLQLTPDQLRVEAVGVLPDLYTRVRVLVASSAGKRVGELSLWANVTRVRHDEDSAGTRGVLTLTLAVQNSRGALRKVPRGRPPRPRLTYQSGFSRISRSRPSIPSSLESPERSARASTSADWKAGTVA